MWNPSHITVLNVNDDESTRYALTHMLRREGFSVMEAEDGYGALEKAREKPDVVILDVKLPDISGFEVCSRLKADPELNGIPVIMVSATYTGAESYVEGLSYGADGYLTWPLELPVIGATIKAILRARQAEERLRRLNETLEERIVERTRELVVYQQQLRYLAAQLNRIEQMERQRIAADLHDNLAQMLSACTMKLAVARAAQSEAARQQDLDELKGLLEDTLGFTRSLMSDLSPPAVLQQEELSVALQWLAEKMRKDGLDVKIEDGAGPVHVERDALVIAYQSVRELLINILKHAGTDRASVTIERSGRFATVGVVDHGKGFDPDVLQSGPTPEGGFGLFNIRERLDLLGGSLQVDSVPGRGTRATLCVPLDAAAAPPVIPDEPARAVGLNASPIARPGAKITVMLVDDHVIVRQGLRSILESQHDVTVVAEAHDGHSALNMAGKLQPDVVVMDVSMPGMDGLEATRKLKASLPQISVIGLSLHQEKDIVEAMFQAGACAYITKDEAFETLGATIRTCVGKARLQA